MTLARGTRLGPYEIVAPLGQGGMGEVYRAHDAKLNRDVALKILPAAFATDAERLARFRREAQVLAALNHPNIGHIYGFEDSGSVHALVLELVDGPTLAEVIAGGGSGVQPAGLPLPQALAVARQMAEAVEAAHEQGITHRDLKPANIKVRADGAVKVLDFGLAKAMDPSPSSSADAANSPTFTAHATAMGVIIGTAAYMSPEQARGKPVDKRADIWSFGAVLFEMLTGRRPFEGDTVSDTIAKILEREPDWSALPPATPPKVRELLHRCLEKDVRKRQRDIGDVRIELDEALASLSSASLTSAPAAARAPGVAFGGRRLGAAAALIVVGAAAGIGVWTLLGSGGRGGAGDAAGGARLSVTMPPDVRAVDARLTPDGRTIVVLGTRRSADGSEEPRARLFTRRLDDYALKPIAGTEGTQNYVLSPDGKALAFIATLSEQTSQRQLAKVPVDGSSPPVKLTDWDDGWEPFPGWLADGDLLIVSNGNTKVFRLPSGGGPAKPAMPLDTGSIAGTPAFGAVLPGDRGIFFGMESWGARGYQLDEWLLDPKTGKATRLFESAGFATYVPTGHVVFTRGDTLMAAPFDPDKLAVTGEVTALFGGVRTPNSWAHGPFAVSNDGTLIYAPGGRIGTDRRLVAIDAAGKVTPYGGDRRGYETQPAVSRDGRQVAAVVANAQGTYETWVADEGRPSPRRVLALPNADCADAIWSPDGRRLAYKRTARDKDDGVFVQAVDGTGGPQVVVKDESREVRVSISAWLPDGSALLLTRITGGKGDLLLASLPSSVSAAAVAPRVLLATPYSELGAVISRDGRFVAFESDESGRPEIYVAPYAQGALGPRTMVSSGGGTFAQWGPDSRRLFYYNDPNKLMSVTLDTAKGVAASSPAVVHDLKALHVASNEWDVLPDGRILAIQKSPAEDDITQFNIITRWFDQLRGRTPATSQR